MNAGYNISNSNYVKNEKEEDQKISPQYQITPEQHSPNNDSSNYLPPSEVETSTSSLKLMIGSESQSDSDIMNKIMKEHVNFLNMINKRQGNLDLVYKYWEKGDIKSAINSLQMVRGEDYSTIMDVLSHTFSENHKMELLTLENIPQIIGLAQNLIKSKYHPYIMTGLKTVESIIKIYGEVI